MSEQKPIITDGLAREAPPSNTNAQQIAKSMRETAVQLDNSFQQLSDAFQRLERKMDQLEQAVHHLLPPMVYANQFQHTDGSQPANGV